MQLDLAGADSAVLEALNEHARRDAWAQRLFDRDTSLWTDDPAVAAAIADRLGWLDAPEHLHRRDPGTRGVWRGDPRRRGSPPRS